MSLDMKQLRLATSSSSSSFGFGVVPLPSTTSSLSTELAELNSRFSLLLSAHDKLKSSIGKKIIDIGGVTFES